MEDQLIIEQIEKACDQSKWTTVTTSNGRKVLVCPIDEFSLLQSLLREERFVNSLQEAVNDFESGRGKTFAKGQRPTAEDLKEFD